MFMLLIQNPLAGDEHEDLSTTKKDKALHGFGLNGMREIVTRYGGIFDAGKKGKSVWADLKYAAAIKHKTRI